jgi:2'-hydroxyisoflavone reductase
MTESALVLGGTSFVGRHLVRRLLDDGWTVTLFNRGQTNAGLFPEVVHLTGDRSGDVSALASGSWDVAFDVNAYHAEDVDRSGDVLRSRCGHYVFVSTVSVYDDLGRPGLTEDDALIELDRRDQPSDRDVYGGRKVQCERRVAALFDSHTVVRPSVVAGPYDPTDRFTYWVVRLGEPGPHAVPPDLDADLQYIDARDLAAFTAALGRERTAGVFNAAAPPQPFGALVETVAAVTGVTGPRVRIPAERLEAEGVTGWTDLPLWVSPQDDAVRGLLSVDASRGLAAGLDIRDLARTVEDTLAWARAEPHDLRAGLSRERVAELARRYA